MTTQKEFCLFHIFSLKFVMAGDSESVELLEKIEERCAAIQWEDPDFVAVSKLMRGAEPTPLDFSKPELASLQAQCCFYELILKMAASSELSAEQSRLTNKAIAQSKILLDLFEKMKSRIEMLGADATEFQIPDDFPG